MALSITDVGNIRETTTSQNTTFTLTQDVAAGDLLVVVGGYGHGLDVNGVSDSQGNTWNAGPVENNTAGYSFGIFWSLITNPLTGGVDTATVQTGANSNRRSAGGAKVVGSSLQLVAGSGNSAQGSDGVPTIDSGASCPDGAAVFGTAVVESTGAVAGSPWAEGFDNNVSSRTHYFEHQVKSGAGTATYDPSSGGSNWSAGIIAFEEGGAAAPEGTGALTLSGVTLAGIGEQPHEGVGAVTLQAPTLAGQGVMHPSGTAALSLSGVTLSASATQEIIGAAAVLLQAATLAGTAVTGASTGDAALVLQGATLAATGVMQPAGAGALTLSLVELAATGEQPHTGTAALVLSGASLAATGDSGQPSGAGAVVLDLVTLAGQGVAEPVGSAAITLQGIVISALAVFTLKEPLNIVYVIADQRAVEALSQVRTVYASSEVRTVYTQSEIRTVNGEA